MFALPFISIVCQRVDGSVQRAFGALYTTAGFKGVRGLFELRQPSQRQDILRRRRARRHRFPALLEVYTAVENSGRGV